MRFFVPAARKGHALFDLAGYIAARLRRAGISHIEDLGLCTYADPDRFSASVAPPTAPRLITAATSTRLRSRRLERRE